MKIHKDKWTMLSEKKTQSAKVTHCAIPLMWLSRKGKTGEIVDRWVVVGVQGGGCWIVEIQGDFGDGETILYDFIMMDIWHDAFLKTHRTL